MGEQAIVTWNAILAGCAQNGFGNEAVKIFENMTAKSVVPDQISFLGLYGNFEASGCVPAPILFSMTWRRSKTRMSFSTTVKSLLLPLGS